MKVTLSKIKYIYNDFSVVEKVFFVVLSFLMIFSAGMLFYSAIDSFRVDAPGKGGTLHEGVVGKPGLINPLLSTTSSGKDLSYLLYSGLMRINEKGILVPDIAESYTISPDGTEYNFVIRKNAKFHDGEPLTTADVAFTIEKAKDPSIKSPVATNWQGVTVEARDEHTIVFRLKTPYAPFLENTTLGIIPKHIWQQASLDEFTFSPYNFEPIGSGPYIVKEVTRDADGSPTLYKLTAWNKYAAGEKNISTLYIHIYSDTNGLINAVKRGEVESAGDLSPKEGGALEKEGFDIHTADLLRVFGVFFNQNQAAVFTDKAVRLALETAVDRNHIIDTVLLSYGNEEDSPLPSRDTLHPSPTEHQKAASDILLKNGWKKNSDGFMEKKDAKGTQALSFTLTTSNNPELIATAEILKTEWEAIGAKVTVVSIEPSVLSETVIRPRKYDALLFGEVIGRGEDLYPFWYSGERKDPGLNIALYTNSKADLLLQKARTATSSEETSKQLSSFVNIIKEDIPAIFLYSPEFIYVIPNKIKGLELPALEMAHERFAGILSSYINAKRVWK
jgi:peptide/nickel transport system substrate-binding protein